MAKFVDFTPCKDPDEFLNQFGGLELKKRIDNAQSFIDAELTKLTPQGQKLTLELKISSLHKAFSIVSPLKNSIYATERLVDLSKQLGLKSTPEQICKEYGQYLAGESTHSPTNISANTTSNLTPNNALLKKSNQAAPRKTYKYSKSIEILLREVIKYPELMEEEKWSEVLDLLWISEVEDLLEHLKGLFFEVDEQEFPQMALDLLNKKDLPLELKSIIGAAVYKYERLAISEKEKDRLLDDLKKRMRKDLLQNEREELLKKQLEVITEQYEQNIIFRLNEIKKKIQSLT